MAEEITPQQEIAGACPKCGLEALRFVHKPYSTEESHEGRTYAVALPALGVRQCGHCGAESLGKEALAQVRRQLREQLGLLGAGEIKEARGRMGLSQKELAERLGVAEATVSRWESDLMIQSRAMDNLLRLYFRLPEVRAQLVGSVRDDLPIPSAKEEHMTDEKIDATGEDFDPWAVGGAVDATGDKRKIALLVGPTPGSTNVLVLAKLHLWAGRAVYLYNLATGEMKHIPRPPQELIDKYVALGRRINHPPGIQAGDTARWVEYGREQAQRLGLKVAK